LVDPRAGGGRRVVLLGIDPGDQNGTWAIRADHHKLIWTYTDRDGWYQPEGEEGDGGKGEFDDKGVGGYRDVEDVVFILHLKMHGSYRMHR
jgi:hypothetical protein